MVAFGHRMTCRLSTFWPKGTEPRSRALGLPFFSGREVEVNTFPGSARALAIGERANATIIVEGPPGCGKSALLDQFSAVVNDYPVHNGRTWIAVPINGAIAMSPGAIMAAVDRAIVTRLAGTATADEGALGRLSKLLHIQDPKSALDAAKAISDRGVAAFGFRIGRKDSQSPRHMEDLVDLRGRQWDEWNIVLMIDEAQHISADSPGSHPGTLSSIHQGLAQLPIIFCAFGLQGDRCCPEGGRRLKAHEQTPHPAFWGCRTSMLARPCKGPSASTTCARWTAGAHHRRTGERLAAAPGHLSWRSP